MPIVAHSALPAFDRLRQEGQQILSSDYALHQDIREIHIGFLNMMPDAALEATERQFMRLVGAANPIAQLRIHLFTIEGLPRSREATRHIAQFYERFEKIQRDGLDALIVSGANVTQADLRDELFWKPLTEVFDWAKRNVTSILCSCLATHALMQYCYRIKRTHLNKKRWGVFSHRVVEKRHPLVSGINTRFDVPHSRFNEVFKADIEAAGMRVLVESEDAGVHLAVSPDLFRIVFFQGHPEYDAISLMKEYKREAVRFAIGEINDYPPFPEHYFSDEMRGLLDEYRNAVVASRESGEPFPEFPELDVIPHLDNTWRDTATTLFNNWLGRVYQITNQNRRLPFMDGIDPENPLGINL